MCREGSHVTSGRSLAPDSEIVVGRGDAIARAIGTTTRDTIAMPDAGRNLPGVLRMLTVTSSSCVRRSMATTLGPEDATAYKHYYES
jgi:hypothetical protein